MNRMLRLLNVIGKRKLGVMVGLLVGLAACLVTPLFFGLFYTNVTHWALAHLHGVLELPLTILMLVSLMVVASLALTGLRILIAHLFSDRRYRTR